MPRDMNIGRELRSHLKNDIRRFYVKSQINTPNKFTRYAYEMDGKNKVDESTDQRNGSSTQSL